MRFRGILATSFLIVACKSDPGSVGSFSSGAEQGDDGTGTSTNSGDGDAEGTGDGSTTDPNLYDVGPGDGTGGTDGESGCKGVDFLFVIDNSGSMGEEQEALKASFGQFISTIENTLDTDDYQILVTSTEHNFTLPKCHEQCMSKTECDLSEVVVDCDDVPPEDDLCEQTLGTGRVLAWPWSECGVDGDQRYIKAGQADLTNIFECVASVGVEGDGTEQPMGAMLAASGDLNQVGNCNEGFVRDDSILVVTFITDEAGDPEMGPNEPQAWHDTLLSVKNDVEEGVVVLGLMADNDLPNPVCKEFEAYPAPRLREFVELFGDRGLVGSVCTHDYSPFFQDAVDLIDTACDDFIPEG
jgi:hypothetical protein